MLTGSCHCGGVRFEITGALGPIACCHCSQYRTASDPDTLRIRLGTLDRDPGGRPVLHVWTASKAPWFELADGLPEIPSLGEPEPI